MMLWLSTHSIKWMVFFMHIKILLEAVRAVRKEARNGFLIQLCRAGMLLRLDMPTELQDAALHEAPCLIVGCLRSLEQAEFDNLQLPIIDTVCISPSEYLAKQIVEIPISRWIQDSSYTQIVGDYSERLLLYFKAFRYVEKAQISTLTPA